MLQKSQFEKLLSDKFMLLCSKRFPRKLRNKSHTVATQMYNHGLERVENVLYVSV